MLYILSDIQHPRLLVALSPLGESEMLLATVPRGFYGKHTFGFRLPLMLAHRASDWGKHRKV